MMRSYWLAVGVAAVAAAGGAALQPPAAAPPSRPTYWPNKLFLADVAANPVRQAPRVVVHDFGVVPHGTLCTHTFKVTNIYDVPLQILEVRKSSDCLEFSATTRPLQPREVGEFTVTMNTFRFVGRRAEKFYVKIGPAPLDFAEIQVQAHSNTDIKLNPGGVFFGTVQEGTAATREVKVEYRGRLRDWKITEVAPWQGPFDVQVAESGRGGPVIGGAEYKVTVSLKPAAPVGVISEAVTFKTNDPATPVIQLAVTAAVVAPLEIFPARVRVDRVAVGQFETRSVYVRAGGGKPFKIEAVRGTDEVVSVERPPADVSLPCQVLIVKFKPAAVGPVARQIRIRTDLDGATATLTVEGEGVKPAAPPAAPAAPAR